MRERKGPWIFLTVGTWSIIVAFNIALSPRRFLPMVQVETAHIDTFPLIVRAPAVLQPKRSAVLKAKFDGPVISRKYQEGAEVHEGDLLLEIGRDRIRSDFESKSNAVGNAKADLLQSKNEVKLQKRLFAKQAVSETAVREAERALVKAAQSLQLAIEELALEKDRWESNRVVAPFNGSVVNDALGQDHEVTSGKELLTVADLSDYELKTRVDELDIGQVKIGQDVEIRIQAYGGTHLQGKVLRMGTQTESSALPEIPVFIQLENASALHLLPKLSAEARIHVGDDPDMISAPLSAVDNADGRPKIWVVDRFGFIKRREVTLGKSNPDRVEITQGLLINEQICVSPEPRWANGMKVRIAS